MDDVDVSVRELRQNLSVHLRRVARGESLRVLSRGRPVAMITPLPERDDQWASLEADGTLAPPEQAWQRVPEPLEAGQAGSIGTALDEVRRDAV